MAQKYSQKTKLQSLSTSTPNYRTKFSWVEARFIDSSYFFNMAHDHTHEHHHHHHPGPGIDQANRRAFIIGIILNLSFVIVEAIAGLLYHSMALLTDAGHNLGDVASLAISLAALWISRRKSSPVYTYGYKKTTILAAFGNAVVLLIAVGMLGIESITRLAHPPAVEGGVIAWVSAAGIIVNGLSAWLFFRHKEKEINARGAYLHLLSDALVSAGVVVAGIVIIYTKWYWLDPVVGLVVMLVILAGTWSLLKDSFRMTIDAVPSGMALEEIKQVMLKLSHVETVNHVHVWPLSTTENALTAHVHLYSELDFEKKLGIISQIKALLKEKNIHHATIEME
jgi:cobalt-zinc-cadmium efflux system protein